MTRVINSPKELHEAMQTLPNNEGILVTTGVISDWEASSPVRDNHSEQVIVLRAEVAALDRMVKMLSKFLDKEE